MISAAVAMGLGVALGLFHLVMFVMRCWIGFRKGFWGRGRNGVGGMRALGLEISLRWIGEEERERSGQGGEERRGSGIAAEGEEERLI